MLKANHTNAPQSNIFLWVMIIFILSISSLSSVSAEIQKLSPVKLNECINLPQVEYDSTYQNLTFILTPNKTIIPIYQYMTKNGFSYKYSFCNTSEVGTYTANGCSDLSCWNYEFEVTRSGSSQTTSQGIASLAFLILMISLPIILGITGFKLYTHDKLWILGFMFLFLSLLLLVYDIWLGFEFTTNYMGSDGAMPQLFFFLFLMALTAGFFMYIVMILKNWKEIKNSFMKALTDKDENDDGWDGGSYAELDMKK